MIKLLGRANVLDSRRVVSKQGMRAVMEDGGEVIVLGGACSEIASGRGLAALLRTGFDFERRQLEALEQGDSASPLSIHTSIGAPGQVDDLLESLRRHRRHRPGQWSLSLQVEGASAVRAACDALLRGNKWIAVGDVAYHGPPSSSIGREDGPLTPRQVLRYPTPHAGMASHETFEAWLDAHPQVGVLVIEPQSGSSGLGAVWPRDLLTQCVASCVDRGIPVISDEVMCGLGRHAQDELFLADAWDLPVSAITVGKALGAGVFPIAGALLRDDVVPREMHTYAGSSARAILAATAVLDALDDPHSDIFLASLRGKSQLLDDKLATLVHPTICLSGIGLLRGLRFLDPARSSRFQDACRRVGVLPYHLPNGCLISPPYDFDPDDLDEGIRRLAIALDDS